MGVFKPKGRATYRMEFVAAGVTHRKDTGETSEARAKLYEANYRKRLAEQDREQAEAKAAGRRAPISFGHGCKLYYEEVAQHQPSVVDTENQLAWLQAQIGADTLVQEIDDAMLSKIIAKRRGEVSSHKTGPKWKDRPLAERLVSDSTVNRTVTEPLKRVLRWLAAVQKQTVQPLEWKRHTRKEPEERVRELFADEQDRLFAAVDEAERDDHADLIEFSLISGLRRMEIIALQWSDVDFGNRLIWITGKGGKRASVPLTTGMRDMIFRKQGEHPDHVFTYKAQSSHAGRERGARYPYTAEGVKTLHRRLADKAGLTDYRWHDHRHTAGTRAMRHAPNPKAVQRLLRHSEIATTMKYAHVYDDDIVAALEGAEQAGGRSRPGAAPAPAPAKRRKEG